MIQMGHRAQKDGTDALKGILKDVHHMDEMADNVNVELDRQI